MHPREEIFDSDSFIPCHIGPNDDEIAEMLREVGFENLGALIDATVPKNIRLDRQLNLPEAKSENEALGELRAISKTCFEGILWILQTGAAWRFLPDEFPSPPTCWRRLKQWEEQDVWLDAWRALLGALDGEGLLKWDDT